MADLMSGSYTYESLAKKYDNFVIPIIKIMVGGSDVVSKQTIAVSSAKITLSVEGAGMAVIKLAGLYDSKNHAFDSSVKRSFMIGTVVELQLGYGSKSMMIFKGYVAMLGSEFGEKSPRIVVTLMDARRLMMTAGATYCLHDVKNYSDAVSKILNKYSKLCSAVVEATSDNLTEPVSQTQNDYLFIVNDLILQGKVDREFFILGDKAYFREPRKSKTPIITMQYGRELLALKVEEEYRDLKVNVFGSDEVKQEAVNGSASVKAANGQTPVLSPTPELNLADPTVDSQKKAADRAKVIAEHIQQKAQTGRGMCIGLPEIVPGRFIKVEKLDSDLGDGTYYLKSVVHEFNGDRYVTMFDIEGFK